MAFDFKKSIIKVQGGRQYLPVSARIVWFREQHPDWGIVTEIIEINHEKQYAVFRATVFDADGKIMATGTKKEDVKGFGDYIEKAETGSVGRALALCGFGTQFSPELDEVGGGRLADSPQPMGGSRYGGSGGGSNYGSGSGNRYGSAPDAGRYGSGGDNGGNRFAPPREVSAPAPSRSEEVPHSEDGASMRAAMDTRRATPAPPPVPQDEGEDDFEALVGADQLLEASEDDPFGDEGNAPPAKPAPAKMSSPAAAPVRTEIKTDGPPACAGCGKALTKAQQDLSIRNYGEALCPTCQKDKPRAGRTAVAAN